MPKLVLVNPVNSRTGLNVNTRSRNPPLNLSMLAAMTPRDRWTVEIQDENWEPAQVDETADLVGFTSFTATFPRAVALAEQYRQIGIPTVIGGIHASMRPDEAREYFDAVVIQDAERVWGQVLADAETGLIGTGNPPRWYAGAQANTFATPDRSVLDFRYHFATVQTSRGCPQRCEFCSVPAFAGHTYRRQPLDLVMRDLRSVSHQRIFFADDNLIGYGPRARQEALDLFRAMVDERLDKRFIMQCTTDVCQDREVLEAARKAGCRMIFIGIEVEDKDGLRSINKRANLRNGIDFRLIHECQMSVLGSYMVGLDTDTPESVWGRARFMRECGADAMQLTAVTPLPGTTMFAELERDGRLLYTDFPRDWERYDMTELVYLPAGFSSEAEFYDLMVRFVERVYDQNELSAMSRETYAATRCMEATAFAFFSNVSYAEIALGKAKIWHDMARRATSCAGKSLQLLSSSRSWSGVDAVLSGTEAGVEPQAVLV